MDFIIILILISFLLCLLFFILQINTKKIKQIADNSKLNNLVSKLPENVQICKDILKILNNEDVKIKSDTEGQTSLYIVATNTISIANIKDSFTRIQTIAHECIHSIQSKKKLMFNFIYTNIYILYLAVILILTLFGKIQNMMLQVEILTILGFIHYFIRSYLEMHAMLKARYIAQQYMEETAILTKQEINNILLEYDKLNNCGIKFMMFTILLNDFLKVLIYIVICLIRIYIF